jgi:hypothetical protein
LLVGRRKVAASDIPCIDPCQTALARPPRPAAGRPTWPSPLSRAAPLLAGFPRCTPPDEKKAAHKAAAAKMIHAELRHAHRAIPADEWSATP